MIEVWKANREKGVVNSTPRIVNWNYGEKANRNNNKIRVEPSFK